MYNRRPPYDVGYGLPPESRRWKKGQSGNPTGRPKGSKNLATIILQESKKIVQVNGPRGTRSMTKLEAALMQLGNKAAQGDFRALRELINQHRLAEESAALGKLPPASNELDRKSMENLLVRLRRISSEAATTNHESDKEESE